MIQETIAKPITAKLNGRAPNLNVVERYFEAWNRRDAAAIMACFAEGGTYSDPAAGCVTGLAIGAYAQGLWSAFPDLTFEIVSAAPTSEDQVAAQWIMRGTNSGSLQGLPPTGRAVELPGADFIRVEGEAIRSVEGYFDQRAVPTQLGLRVIVQPRQVGPFVFGTTAAAQSGRRTKPGAFSITSIQVRSEEEVERVRNYSFQIAQDMLKMPGFIGWMGAILGERMVTITAWEDVEGPHQLAKNNPHHSAVADFYQGGLGSSAFISVWAPKEIKAYWVRCPNCQRMMDYAKSEGICACDHPLPEPPAYW